MHHAVRASCGEGARILSTRQPTVLEAMVGIASILHVARADGREVGCGIIWHGPLAVALQADFPRFDLTPALSVAQSTALAALLDAERLIACETREDELGLAVVTSRCGAGDLMLARFDGETPTLVPYRPGYPADVTPDQQQWLHYIETYEALTVLDAYRDGTSTALIVLTGDADGAVFRHHVDSDGIEDWRGPDTGSAVGTLYQARRGGDLAPTDPPRPADAEPAWDHAASADAKPPRTAPVDTMAITATAPFGDAVEAQFPAAAYDIDEASHCVALRRPTASVMHCLRVLEHGLRAHALWRGIVDPSPSAGRRWRSLLTDLRRAEPDPDLLAALDTVRRAWRGATLEVAAKYTEEEAERILHAVESFMRCLAERCDEAGEPADHPDDGTIA
jgi:hypothetical protein